MAQNTNRGILNVSNLKKDTIYYLDYKDDENDEDVRFNIDNKNTKMRCTKIIEYDVEDDGYKGKVVFSIPGYIHGNKKGGDQEIFFYKDGTLEYEKHYKIGPGWYKTTNITYIGTVPNSQSSPPITTNGGKKMSRRKRTLGKKIKTKNTQKRRTKNIRRMKK
jgi:hypothetical protein